MIHELASYQATLENCPMFMHHYQHTQPYAFWTPWQPDETLGKWSTHKACQNNLFCDKMFPLNESRLIAQAIYNHQHPRECDKASYLVVSGEWNGGFGSAIHVKARVLLLAMQTGRVLIDADNNRWRFSSPETCERTSMECYFAPMTHCSLEKGWKGQAEPIAAVNSSARIVVAASSTDVAKLVDRQGRYQGFGHENKPDMWWFTQASVYLVRPNVRTLKAVCFAWNCLMGGRAQPDRPFASMFFRAGDKFKEAAPHQPHEYFNMLWFLSHDMAEPVRSVYVGSDSALLLNDVLQDYSGDWNLIWMGHFRGASGSRAENEKSTEFTPLIELRSLITLADIYISAAADILVGTLTSNQCRLMDELRKVAGKARMPYLTPEGTLDTGIYG